MIDEFGALGAEGRHVVPLMARMREAGMACVLATHGLADLARVDRPLPQQVVQNAGTRVVFRQGSHEDAEHWAYALGQVQREELSRKLLDGKDRGEASTQWRRDFRVQPEDLFVLGPGEAVVQVAPLGRGKERLQRVKLAEPSSSGSPPTPGHRPTRGRRRVVVTQHRSADDLPPLHLDDVAVDQVLSNLIEYAAKYAPPVTEIEITAAGAGASP